MAFPRFSSGVQIPPVLTLKTVQQPDGTILLFVNPNDNPLPHPTPQQQVYSLLPGDSVQDFFLHDTQSLDEWIDFYARVQHHVGDLRQYLTCEGTYCKRILQYFHTLSGWVITTITCRHDSEWFTVQISPASVSDAPTSLNALQMMEMKQALWLDKVLTGTGRWELDLEKQSAFLSRPISVLLGLGNCPQSVSLAQFFSTVYPDDLATVTQALEDAGSLYSPVFSRSVRPDGTVLHLRSFAIPEFNSDGTVIRVVGVSQDITEQVHTAEDSSLSQKRFFSMMEHSGIATFIISNTGFYSYASPNVKTLYGITAGELIGSRFGDLLSTGEESHRVFDEFQKIMHSRSPGHIEFHYQNPASGAPSYIRMSVSPLINSQGNLLEAMVTAQDITPERQHEDRLRYLQTHDMLTDTYNRAYFERELEQIQLHEVAPVSLIIADLNGLKVVNDAFGHEMGDHLLVETANILKSVCGPSCTVARIGGDEFAILLYNTSLTEAESISEALIDSCKTAPVHLLPISLSCGVACREAIDFHTATMYQSAESRLINSKLLESRSMHSQVISSLKEAIGVRNVETFEHMSRMERMVSALGKRLKLSSSEFDRLLLLASLHDIGKVAIPDHIINKPGRLEADEWIIMRSHSDVGYRIAMASSELSGIAEEIRAHHEHWDGDGYPSGKSGRQIPLLSRIISVVDAYDVMTSKRVYKEPISHQAALDELQRCSGTQFDPDIVLLFVEIFGTFSQGEMQHFTNCCGSFVPNSPQHSLVLH